MGKARASSGPLASPTTEQHCTAVLRRRRLLPPARPVLGAVQLDLEMDHCLDIDAKDRGGTVFRQPAFERLAVNQQALRALAFDGELAVLEPLAPRRAVGPRPRAVHVRCPQEAAAAAVARFHRGVPERHDYRAVPLAHAAPAGARIVEPDAARFEAARARHELWMTLEPRRERRARRAAAWALFEERRAQGSELLLAEPLGVRVQIDELLPAESIETLARPGAGAVGFERRSDHDHSGSSIVSLDFHRQRALRRVLSTRPACAGSAQRASE